MNVPGLWDCILVGEDAAPVCVVVTLVCLFAFPVNLLCSCFFLTLVYL